MVLIRDLFDIVMDYIDQYPSCQCTSHRWVYCGVCRRNHHEKCIIRTCKVNYMSYKYCATCFAEGKRKKLWLGFCNFTFDDKELVKWKFDLIDYYFGHDEN